MVVPVDWQALRTVFEGAAVDGVAGHSDLLRELAEERAAIMEFDGGLSKEDAEAYAFSTFVKKPTTVSGSANI